MRFLLSSPQRFIYCSISRNLRSIEIDCGYVVAERWQPHISSRYISLYRQRIVSTRAHVRTLSPGTRQIGLSYSFSFALPAKIGHDTRKNKDVDKNKDLNARNKPPVQRNIESNNG